MMRSSLRWVINIGVFCCAVFYLSIPSPATSISLPKILSKFGATEQRIQVILRPLLTGDAVEEKFRAKRQKNDENATETSTEVQNNTEGAAKESSTESITTTKMNITTTKEKITTIKENITKTNSKPETQSSTVHLKVGERADDDPIPITEIENTTIIVRNDTEEPAPTSHYTLRPAPSINRDIVQNLPEREGEDEAIVETRPYLLHPPFTTYILIVTIPCIIGWCLLTFVCLWICRPNSPLYREILKRLIEHSQMKQKSVLFSATVLAADKHAGAQATTSGEGPSKEKA